MKGNQIQTTDPQRSRADILIRACFASGVTIATELSTKMIKSSFPDDQAVEKVADIYDFPGT